MTPNVPSIFNSKLDWLSTLSPNSTQFLWQNRNTARDYLEPSIAGFVLENSFYYGGKTAIGPEWDPGWFSVRCLNFKD